MNYPMINITPGVPDEVQQALIPHLNKWLFLVPSWCHELCVCWGGYDTDAALSITVHCEYRRADLFVHPDFLSNHERREAQVIHELMHITTEPMAKTIRDLRVLALEKNHDLRPLIDEQIRMAIESVTCDLTALVHAIR